MKTEIHYYYIYFMIKSLVRAASLAALLAGPLASFDGEWHVHTSMSDVRDIDVHGGKLYGATAGGLIVVNAADGASRSYSIAEGLGGTSVSRLAVDKAGGKVYLALDNGCLSVFDNGAFRIYTDFKGQNGIRFNKLLVHKGTLIIATNQGVSFFTDGAGAIVYPSFDKFGDETNPYLNRAREVRDLTVKDDTLYLLTRFFWAKTRLDWTKPLLEHNPSLRIGSPKLWTTNGREGDFLNLVMNSDSTTDTLGYTAFAVLPDRVIGLMDLDTYLGPDGITIALNSDDTRAWIHACGLRDTLFFNRPSNALVSHKGCAVDENGQAYAATNGMGILRVQDNRIYWNGDEQAFSYIAALRVDPYGNVYATNNLNAGAYHYNSFVNMGVLKFDGTRWKHIFRGVDGTATPGLNDIALDPRGRLAGSFSSYNSNIGAINHGFVFFDNPFLGSDTLVHPFSMGYLDFTPFNANLSDYGLPVVDATQAFCPTAMQFDNSGYFYFSHSTLGKNSAGQFVWLDKVPSIGVVHGQIKIFKDLSFKGSFREGPYEVNTFDYGTAGNFKCAGIVPWASTFVQPEGHFSSLAVDKAGNIWVTGQASGEFNVFGKRIDLSDEDTLIFDNQGGIQQYLSDPGAESGTMGVPECRRGLNAHLASKICKKVKSDPHGDIWISTTAGLFYYADGGAVNCRWSGCQDSPSKTCDSVTVFRNVGGEWRYFLPDIAINDFDFDTLNNVWIATDNAGLKMLHYNTARYYTEDACYGKGDYSGIKYDSYTSFSGLISDRVLSVAVHRQSGRVFLGFENGLQEFESGIREAGNVEEGYAYPVLVRPPSEEVFLNTRRNGSSVYVYTLSGKLVFHEKLSSSRSGVLWNTRNAGNRRVSAGVYLYRFVAPDKTAKTGKFAILR